MQTQAAGSDEARAQAAWLAGRSALAGGRPEEALAAFERAQALDPRPDRILRIARVLELLGRDREAIARYEAWLLAQPGHPRQPEVLERLDALRARAERVLVLEGLDLSAEAAAASAEQDPAAQGTTAPVSVPPGLRLDADASPSAGGTGRSTDAPPLTRRWWFWAGVGGAAAVVVTGLALAGTEGTGDLPAGSLGTIDRRTP